MKIQFRTLFGLFLSLLFSCSNPKLELQKDISKMEASPSEFNKTFIDSLTGKYLRFVELYPKDTIAPLYLFKASNHLNVTGNYLESVKLFNRLIKDYPNYPKVPEALFTTAFIYENNLKDLGRAKTLYETFLKRYPNHELAVSVEFTLQNLGKSAEEIFNSFPKDSEAAKAVN